MMPLSDDWPRVDLFRWKPKVGDNFGDQLSEIIVHRLLAKNRLTIFDEAKRSARLLAVGSILHFARDNDVIWGSGIRDDQVYYNFKQIDVRAVRGPITWEFLRKRGIRAPEVFGDPAWLLPQLFSGWFTTKPQRHAVTIILHLADGKMPDAISASAPWNVLVERIISSQLVVSSSLHGLVVADAFGIPSRYLRLSDYEPLIKFEDYYAATGRPLCYSTCVDAAVEMGGAPKPEFDVDPLIEAFPFDLWR